MSRLGLLSWITFTVILCSKQWCSGSSETAEPSFLLDDINPDLRHQHDMFVNTKWRQKLLQISKRRRLQNENDRVYNQTYALSEVDRRVANSDECYTPYDDYVGSLIDEMGDSVYYRLLEYEVDFIVYTYKFSFDVIDDDECIGYDGVETDGMFRMKKRLEKFWKKKHSMIRLMGLHSREVLEDETKLIAALRLIFNSYSIKDIVARAKDISKFIRHNVPRGYDNQMFTLTSISTRKLGYLDAILIGDGLIDFLYQNGLKRHGPKTVLAHEFAHIVLCDLNNDSDNFDHSRRFAMAADTPFADHEDDPEKTRQFEMTSDALAAYFLAPRVNDVNQVLKTIEAMGDCLIHYQGHHGKPDQRHCAAVWGANEAYKDCNVVHAKSLVKQFDESLDMVLSLDKKVCTLQEKSYDSCDSKNHGENKSEKVNNRHLSLIGSEQASDSTTTDQSSETKKRGDEKQLTILMTEQKIHR